MGGPKDDSRGRPRTREVNKGSRAAWDDWLTRDWTGSRAESKAQSRPYNPLKSGSEVPSVGTRAHLRGWLLAHSYYAALNANEGFRTELDQLAQDASNAEPPIRARLIQEFASQWRMPRRLGIRDIEWSLGQPPRGRRFRLMVTPRMAGANRQLRLPHTQRNREYLEDVGRDMFRFIFRDKTWDDLAEADDLDSSTVRKRVIGASRLFDIRLPLRKPGRPRKLGK